MIEIRCCHSLSDAEPYRSAINALNLASPRPDPFSTFEFYDYCLRNAVRVLGNDRIRLWLVLAFSGGDLIGYIALKQTAQRVLWMRARKIDWLTAYVAGRPHLVSRAAESAAVSVAIYQYLLACRQEWDLLEFQQQEVGSALLPPPEDAISGAFRVRSWPCSNDWTIPMHDTSATQFFASLSKKFRSNVSRQMRRLMKAGEVRVLTSTDAQTLTTLFQLYRCIVPHSWKAQATGTDRDGARLLDYYQSLRWSADQMQVVVQVFVLDDVPIAGMVCGVFGERLYALDIVFDDRYAHLAPGQAILLLGVRMAIEGGFSYFDLNRGSGYYKTRWHADVVRTSSLQIYRTRSPLLWRRTLGDAARRWFDPYVSEDEMRFNPLRRAVVDDRMARMEEVSRVEADHTLGTPQTRLVAEALDGCGEFLSARQLAAVLPFDTVPGHCDKVRVPERIVGGQEERSARDPI